MPRPISDEERSHREYVEEMKERMRGYHRAYYENHREERKEALRKRRAERKQWLKDYLVSQNCELCGFPSKAATLWHHRNALLDHYDPNQNLAQARHLAHQGYSYERIKEELANLIPLCGGCLAKTRSELLTEVPLTPRQQYMKDRYELKHGEILRYQQNRRRELRIWLANELTRPCAVCMADNPSVEWHYIDPTFDYEEGSKNLVTLRYMVNSSMSQDHMRRELSRLLPVCAACFPAWRQANE